MSAIFGGSGAITTETGDANQVAFFNGADTLDGVAEFTWTDGTKTLAVNGVLELANGLVSAPSLANIGDTHTGFFFPADDVIAVATDGTERARFLATGEFMINTTA